ncbi:MAG: carboxypeptidase regulatory-like domain-containing protein [Gemmatimonadales bacterium]|nr:carboxypeptidase regulatory-like domain-containing protein [Gemmatimonadales bacterium]
MRTLCLALIACTLSACAEIVSDAVEYGEITVQAARTSGDPVPGAQLVLYIGERAMADGETGPDGRHTFSFVPPNNYGVYAEPPEGFVRPEELEGGSSTTTVDGIALMEGGAAEATFRFLKVGPGVVEVSIVDGVGVPLPDIEVSLRSPTGTVAQGMSNGAGKIEFRDVAFGHWAVGAVLPESFRGAEEYDVVHDGILMEEGHVESVRLELTPCLGKIVAHVQTGGTPVANYPVVLYAAVGVLAEGLTSPDGAATFAGVACGDLGVAIKPEYGWDVPAGRGTSFVDGLLLSRGGEESASFSVSRCVGTVIAHVTDQAGDPVSGAALTLFVSTGVLAEATTGEAGAYTFTSVGCRIELGVRVTPPPGYTVVQGRGTSFLDGILLEPGQQKSVTFRVAKS